MKIFKVALQTLLIAQFSFFGISKVIGTPDMVETFTTFGYPGWFMVLTGLIELAAVTCLLYGFVKGRFVFIGAFLITCLTIGAALSHFFLEGSVVNGVIPLIVLAQTCLMCGLQETLESRAEAKKLAVA